MIKLLDLRQLETFATVVRNCSFTDAAGQLNMTQAAVSQHIKKLEANVGHRLLERSPKFVTLTPEGEILLPFAIKMLALEQASLNKLANLEELRGKIRLGVPEEIASCGLPRLLAEFRRLHPKVSLEVQVGLTAPQLERLDARELDLVLGKHCGNVGKGDSLWTGELRWAGAPGIVHAERPIPLALFSEACVLRKATLLALEQAQLPYEVVFTSSSFSGLRAAATAGFAITVLPSEMLEPGLVLATSDTVLPPLPDLSYRLFIGYGGSRQNAVMALSELIRNTGRDGLIKSRYASGS